MLHLPGKWPQSTKRYGRSSSGAVARPRERPPLVQQIVHWLARLLRAMVGPGHDDVLRAGLRSDSLGAGVPAAWGQHTDRVSAGHEVAGGDLGVPRTADAARTARLVGRIDGDLAGECFSVDQIPTYRHAQGR